MTAKQIAAALLTAHPTALKITPTGDPTGTRLDWIVQTEWITLETTTSSVIDRTLPAGSLQQARLVQREFKALRRAA